MEKNEIPELFTNNQFKSICIENIEDPYVFTIITQCRNRTRFSSHKGICYPPQRSIT